MATIEELAEVIEALRLRLTASEPSPSPRQSAAWLAANRWDTARVLAASHDRRRVGTEMVPPAIALP